MYFGHLMTVSQEDCGSYPLVPAGCVRDPRQQCKKGNWAGSGLFCIQSLFPLCCAVSIWFGVPSISTYVSLSCLVHLKSNALLESQFSRHFAVYCVSKADGLFTFYLSYDRFFSGRFVQTWLSNSLACVSIFCCKLLYCSWIHLTCDPTWDSCLCLKSYLHS